MYFDATLLCLKAVPNYRHEGFVQAEEWVLYIIPPISMTGLGY